MKNNWKTLIEGKKYELVKTTRTVTSFTRRLGSWSPSVLLKIYQAKCASRIRYGSEIWGYTKIDKIHASIFTQTCAGHIMYPFVMFPIILAGLESSF